MAVMAEKVLLDPSDKVFFTGPFEDTQAVELCLKNTADQSVIFKMKSTRPLRFKMRPVFGLIEPGATKNVLLICRPFDPSARRPRGRDRFSVMLAPAPFTCKSAALTWTANDSPEVQTQAIRRVVSIVYKLDDAPSSPSPPSSMSHNSRLSAPSSPSPPSSMSHNSRLSAPSPIATCAPQLSKLESTSEDETAQDDDCESSSKGSDDDDEKDSSDDANESEQSSSRSGSNERQ